MSSLKSGFLSFNKNLVVKYRALGFDLVVLIEPDINNNFCLSSAMGPPCIKCVFSQCSVTALFAPFRPEGAQKDLH